MENKNLKDFIISLDLKRNPVEELRYDQKNDRLKIYITPRDHDLTLEDFEFSHNGEQLDLENIKTLGSIMARLKFNKEKNIVWSAILKRDNVKNPVDFSEILEELKNKISGMKSLVIFNESGFSFAWAENRSRLQNLSHKKRGRFHNDYVEFSTDTENLKSEIEYILSFF